MRERKVCEEVLKKIWGLLLTCTTQRAGKGSAGSALVCLCSELPGILFLNAERRNNTLVLLMLTAIHTPTHNMSIKCLLPPLFILMLIQGQLRLRNLE